MRLRDGKITEYHEVANTAPAFVDIKFAPDRIAKIVAKQGAALKARPEMKRHLVEWSTVIPGCAKREPGISRFRVHRCAMPGSDAKEFHGGGTFVIGLRCASAATVDVPIGPCLVIEPAFADRDAVGGVVVDHVEADPCASPAGGADRA